MAKKSSAKAKVGVLGASGYTGSELVRLLLRHPHVDLVLLTADRRAGQEMRAMFPQFSTFKLPKLVSPYGVNSSRLTSPPEASTTTLLLPRWSPRWTCTAGP